MSIPPVLPEITLRRVLRLARFDGLGVLIFAGFFGLLSAAAGDYRGAVIGLTIAGAGTIELHGVALLRGGFTEGMNWLIGSQFFLMAAMLGYCAFRLAYVVIPPIPPNAAVLFETAADRLGLTTEEYMQLVYRLTFQLGASVTVLYQGAMAVYYIRKRNDVIGAVLNQASIDNE